MIKRLTLFALCIIYGCACHAFDLSNPNLSTPDDTIKANQIISELKGLDVPFGDKVLIAAKYFNGCNKDDYYNSSPTAQLRINLDEFSPLMYINTCLALARASENPGNSDWRTFASELERLSCAKGMDNGYPSLMYHTSEWIVDNISRGNVKELTENFSGVIERTKSLDEMTRNRSNFAVLADSAIYESIRMKELGFRTFRVPTLKKETIKKKDVIEELRNGDIIILVPNRDGIDSFDIGFVEMHQGEPYLMHVSPQTEAVTEEKEPLSRYMQLMTKHFQGYRILRPTY